MTRARPRALLALVGSAAVLATVALTSPVTASAAGPQSVTVPSKPGKTAVTWSSTVPFANNTAGIAVDDPMGSCDPANPELNDQHQVKVVFPKGLSSSYDTLVRFSIKWKADASGNTTNDLAMHLFGPDGKLVASSDGSQMSEAINVTDRRPGVYTVLVCMFQGLPVSTTKLLEGQLEQGTPYTGTVSAFTVKAAGFAAAKGVTRPAYQQFTAPKGVAAAAGEPSIGNNWKSGNTLYTANTNEYVVRFNDKKRSATWTLVNDDVADPSNKISLDPIGFTDPRTGRTFVSQLYLACSGAAYSDDDFDTQAIPSQGCGTVVNGVDHQTFGGGRFPENVTPLGTYPHAVYYCAQGIALVLGQATCARSDDGGLTFGPGIPAWKTECTGIHGHVQVSPRDGTVYLPNAGCGDRQGVAVSGDGGTTWEVRTIPDSLSNNNDPYVGVATDGTLYFSYSDGTGHVRVAVSRDKGKTWAKSVDVGVPYGVRNSEFAMVVAGDGDRAAVAFLGTKTPGSTQAASFGKNAAGDTFTGGEWHMYVSTTYDRGRTWTTVDATPTDPVQRGCIWNGGGSNPCRNLLDFNGMALDKSGRVLVGFADGCVGPNVVSGSDCVRNRDVGANKRTEQGAIIRQMSGKTLFRAYDKKAPATTSGSTSGGVLPVPGNAPSQPRAVDAPGAADAVDSVDASPASSSRGLGRPAGAVVLVLLLLAGGWYAVTRRMHRTAA
ncbi:MAG TPA: sialidase family protein [Mycobacteriales bacterium]|nr:sialidase family protein [Mycobacteriales bacterium]